MRALLLVLILSAGCKKADDAPKAPAVAPVTAGTVAADGVRTIPIAVTAKGYDPDRIAGKPNEKLKLVFTRTGGGECTSELKTPDGKLVPLPMNTAVDVPVTVPKDGEVKFACGMDMFTGVIVAEKT
ncbi:MAG: cupredoxin domain-containing protein [Kofleriaceae bacterium]